MRIAFFVSSIGDTDLAKASIARLVEQNLTETIYIVPLTPTALSRTEDVVGKGPIVRFSLDQIAKQQNVMLKEQLTTDELEKITGFIEENKIQHAYIGVPSMNSHTPFQIAVHLKIACTIAYEFMFKPANHSFWGYVDRLANKGNCNFAVPLLPARKDIHEINAKAKVYEIGHLSIDRAFSTSVSAPVPIKKALAVENESELVFVSGTTQPLEVDNQFLEALLSELSTEKYNRLQLRLGIHPGVKDPDAYLHTLLKTCDKFPKTSNQFKILLPQLFEKRLVQPVPQTAFILRSEVSGNDAAQAADKIAQAVPGALLNEAALKGKPSYFHEKSASPYLPKEWFAESLAAFFAAKPKPLHEKEELGLQDTAPDLLIKLNTKIKLL